MTKDEDYQLNLELAALVYIRDTCYDLDELFHSRINGVIECAIRKLESTKEENLLELHQVAEIIFKKYGV